MAVSSNDNDDDDNGGGGQIMMYPLFEAVHCAVFREVLTRESVTQSVGPQERNI